MTSSSTNSGVSTITVTFDVTRDQDVAAVDVQNRVNQALGRMPAEVRTTGITVQKQSTGFVMAVGVFAEKGEYDSLFLEQLPRRVRQGRAQAHPRRRRRHHLRRAQVLDAPLARSGPPRRAAASPPATSSARCASRTCRSPPAASASRRRRPARCTSSASAPSAACAKPPSSTTSSSRAAKAASLVRLKDVGRAELGAETYCVAAALPGRGSGRLRRHPAADRQRARRRARGRRGDGAAGRTASRRACATRSRSTRPTSSRTRSARC